MFDPMMANEWLPSMNLIFYSIILKENLFQFTGESYPQTYGILKGIRRQFKQTTDNVETMTTHSYLGNEKIISDVSLKCQSKCVFEFKRVQR